MLPHLGECGWEGHVLAFDPNSVEASRDEDLLQTIPADCGLTLVSAISPKLTRRLGFGSLSWRGYASFRKAAEKLIKQSQFDVAFYSTTIFGFLPLGPKLKSRHGLPYVVDFQDPWVSDYYRKTGVRPPGGHLRYAISSRSARKWEPQVVRHASHVIAVSPAYPTDMRRRYPDVPESRFSVLPFAAAPRDFEVVQSASIKQTVFDPQDRRRHWVYLGRGGDDMAKALRLLFGSLKDLRTSISDINNIRMHFVGTSYAPKALAKETIMPVACEYGLEDLVEEQTSRLPYMQGLSLLQSSDVVLVVGSDDPGYSASKVYPCVASGRPVLAIMHRESSAGKVIEDCGAGQVVRFDSSSSNDEVKKRLNEIIIDRLKTPIMNPSSTDWKAFEPYTARFMTRKICDIFDRVAKRTLS